MVPIKVNKWNSLVQQVEENRQNILTLSETPSQFNAKGEWNSTTVYAQNDMINYNGSSYFSLQDSNANHTPGASDSAAWWQLLAAQGEQGVQGEKGETGATGPAGSTAYTHLINFSVLFPNTNAYGIVSLLLIRNNSMPFGDFSNFITHINNAYDGKYYPISVDSTQDYKFIKCASANSDFINLSAGIGLTPPKVVSVYNSMVINFSDTVF